MESHNKHEKLKGEIPALLTPEFIKENLKKHHTLNNFIKNPENELAYNLRVKAEKDYTIFKRIGKILASIVEESTTRQFLHSLLESIKKNHTLLKVSPSDKERLRKSLLLLFLVDPLRFKERMELQLTPPGHYVWNFLNKNVKIKTLQKKIKQRIFAKPGKIFSSLGSFFAKDVKEYHNFIINDWEPPQSPISLFLPCSNNKPISSSFMQKKIRSIVRNMGLDEDVSIFIVSEPLGIIPQSFELFYPAAHYDFPPEKVQHGKNYEKYRDIVKEGIKKITAKSERYIYSLPKTHKEVFEDSLSSLPSKKGKSNFIYSPYHLYHLPKLKEALEKVKK